MDSLLGSLVGTALAEMGDRAQWLFLALMLHFGERQRVLIGLVFAFVINSLISAISGYWLGQYMTDYPQYLFLGMALFLAGVTMFFEPWRKKQVPEGANNVLRTSFLSFLVLGFADRSQFIIAANAARDVTFAYSAIGGIIGICLAMMPVLIFGRSFKRRFRIKWVRTVSGLLLIIGAILLALRALSLIN